MASDSAATALALSAATAFTVMCISLSHQFSAVAGQIAWGGGGATWPSET